MGGDNCSNGSSCRPLETPSELSCFPTVAKIRTTRTTSGGSGIDTETPIEPEDMFRGSGGRRLFHHRQTTRREGDRTRRIIQPTDFPTIARNGLPRVWSFSRRSGWAYSRALSVSRFPIDNSLKSVACRRENQSVGSPPTIV